ncbi:hypothetical protein [Thermodesulforhabdus norvegica]|uniref:Uncharacterized protein n=1 Tax=Thermodesulforhabdus norvegica TaxID=39841 RepID=A0A1I4TYD2_9BACT|nr:hypothetical protein [Thermodesulforhabdus norvegica]SFM81732.1 hypothetical protein SAMN05660836_01593 [Thermodesulforhabdus norvegica]
MRITQEEVLEKSCKEIIETILACLDHAIKGTIYLIGPLPELRAIRITSGVRDTEGDEIRWGLPEHSDYNFPGKTWLQYRDEPGRPLEAMAWCVERQRSWTADNPAEDTRSVRKQLVGELEDYHHMEPVLVRKADIYGSSDMLEYPLTWDGKPIWQDTEYAVVAVIKIHFLPNTIRRGDKSTKLVKRLARVLGSDILSLHLREAFCEVRRSFERKRLESCNELAHQLRNPIMKLGFIASAINAEIALLRQQWEHYISQQLPELMTKDKIMERLHQILVSRLDQLDGHMDLKVTAHTLLRKQKDFQQLGLHPSNGREWILRQIEPLWEAIFEATPLWSDRAEEVRKLLQSLKEAIWYGLDESIISRLNHIPEEVKETWSRLAYSEFSPENTEILEEILTFLEYAPIEITHGQHIRRVLSYLKSVTEVVQELEERANAIIDSLRNMDLEPIISSFSTEAAGEESCILSGR